MDNLEGREARCVATDGEPGKIEGCDRGEGTNERRGVGHVNVRKVQPLEVNIFRQDDMTWQHDS